MDKMNIDDIDKLLLEQNGHIIHQVWFGTMPNKRKAKKDYEKFKKYRDSWINNNPGWFRCEWNKKMAEKFIRKFFPEHYEMYKQYPYEIQRCDAVRYAFLYRYGGLYADMDFYCNKPFDDALKEFPKDFYLVQTPNREGEYVSNSLMYSKPKHPFWKTLLVEMQLSKQCPIYYSKHLIIMYASGPGILNRVYHKYKSRYALNILPKEKFQPYGQNIDVISLNTPNVYTIHLSRGCWHSGDSALIVLISRSWKIILFILFFLVVVNSVSSVLYRYNVI